MEDVLCPTLILQSGGGTWVDVHWAHKAGCTLGPQGGGGGYLGGGVPKCLQFDLNLNYCISWPHANMLFKKPQ